MRRTFVPWLGVLVTFLPLLCVSGLQCPVPAGDSINICAMCSDTDAAVRWTVREDATFDIALIQYDCTDENGTVVYDEINDSCFEQYLDWLNSHTGTTGVGYQLWTGLTCQFTLGYRVNRQTLRKSTSCTVKGPEECAEHPDECNIDRMSEVNEEGECDVQCAAGYGGDQCNNIDECQTSNKCDDNAECHDTDGSYWCQCLPGFQGDGYNCTNIDECTAGSNTCDDNAECHDTDGSYWCQCLPGFQGDGYNCTDFDECDNATCDENAECLNTEGSFSCQCRSGFTGDGYNCTDINECLNVTCVENAECLNTEGTYSCQCNSGFTGDGYSNCTDIDECMEETHGCTDGSYCMNSMGSYYCNTNVIKTGSTNVVVVVVVPVLVVCGVLVSMLLLTVSLIAIHCHMKRQKMPVFDELTKMDLDPYYTPKFWNGSLLSIRSFYEKLIFAESTTDISGSQERQQEYSHKDKQPILILEKADDPEHRVVLRTQHENSRHKNDYASHSSFSNPRGQQQNSQSPTEGIDNKMEPPSDTLVTPGKDKTSPNGTLSCVNYTFDEEVAFPDIVLPSPGMAGNRMTVQTMTGYVQECSSSWNCSQQQVAGCDNAKRQETHDGGSEVTVETRKESDYIDNSTFFTSGLEVVGPPPSHKIHKEPISAATVAARGEKQQLATDYVPANGPDSVGSSSGYSSDSALVGELPSSALTDYEHSLSTWHSQTSLQSSDTVAEPDLDSVKFTVNARQEFEYVNAMEEKYLTDITFDILPQDTLDSSA